MAATDQNYRSQHTLDIIFAVSSLGMLLTIVWMFWDDYNRPYKAEQRAFREVEPAMAVQLALEQLPSKEEFDAKKKAFEDARKQYEYYTSSAKFAELKAEYEKDQDAAKKGLIDSIETYHEAKGKLVELQPKREKADATFQDLKADVEEASSAYAIAMDERDSNKAGYYDTRAKAYSKKLAEAAAKRDAIVAEMKSYQSRLDKVEKPVTDAQSAWKKVTDKFDTQVKLAYAKQWGFGDWVRALPIIDGFASPFRIQQVTNNDIPIDYNFKMVTRFDRCQTCHLGIDRPAYTKEALRSLTQDETPEQKKRLEEALAMLEERTKAYEGMPDASRLPRKSQLKLRKISADVLTDARINEYAVHPRLELFVGANSKHPAERFGCSACHYGQGSATDFTLAAHTPNSSTDRKKWEHDHSWEAQHMWDFPMLPHRFVESSCLKCHYEVTDLISSENRVEAPKLLRGYNLIKDNGCFGCHEIAGKKGDRIIGPDLRTEPYPPLDDLTPGERVKAERDEENPPGTLRKVGPSLFRLSEKTNEAWTAKWIRSPRGFRPDTKMPHFFGNSNNDFEVLKESMPDLKWFPDAEMHSIAYYLFRASEKYVKDIKAQHDADKPADRAKDEKQLTALLAKGKEKLDKDETAELAALRRKEKLRNEKVLVDPLPDYEGDKKMGRQLFTEKGCLACHAHEGTTRTQGKKGDETYTPAVTSEALFGPNLSQVAAKLGKKQGDADARKWLRQWIIDPHVHSPRSRMPVTHLTAKEAADVAAWLLAQPPEDLGDEWMTLEVGAPSDEVLQNLARAYLVSALIPTSDIDTLFKEGKLPEGTISGLPDEQALAEGFATDKSASLKRYIGKKAVGRLGCYACHDIPGFDAAKPIGVALNDWGKKPADRLAFEDINNFVAKHFVSKPGRVDPATKKPYTDEDGKKPYEAFFYDDLMHHGRTGYLHQKLLDPRSYDYGRKKEWVDLARMPQFRFARARKHPGEDDKDFEARAWMEEAEAREAVMTFILGLVAEQVPMRMVNQPKGDRQHEVKGRQVLDKYNCAGCHLIRPGAYDFKVSPAALESLNDAADQASRQVKGGMYVFPQHHFWSGKNPANPDRLIAAGVKLKLVTDDAGEVQAELTLAEALRFVDKDKALRDIPTSLKITIPIQDLHPELKQKPIEELQKDVDRLSAAKVPYGGRFADLLVPYLVEKDPSIYKPLPPPNERESSEARVALPPSLIGEGERVQNTWLVRFLEKTPKVRRMTVLQMPYFNMSQREREAIVDYFGAVERITNPGIGFTPNEAIPQQTPFDDPFWTLRNSAYIARLRSTGPEDGKTKWFDQRMKEFAPAWEHADELAQAAIQADVTRAKKQKADAKTQMDETNDKLKSAKDKVQTAELKAKLSALETITKNLDDLLGKLNEESKASGPDSFKKAYIDREAYVTDAFRLIANKDMCLGCHEVAGYRSSNPTVQGPPLEKVHERLRPDWVLRWVATPQRHITYISVMQVNFPHNKKDFQNILTGEPIEQIEAIRDTLMNYPRVLALPVNRQWNPNFQAEKKE
jgi:cytochrome c peroxidase